MQKRKVKAQFVTITLAWLITICLQAMVQACVVFFTTTFLRFWWTKPEKKSDIK